MFWLPSREAMVPPSLPCPPSCLESCVVLLYVLSDRCPLLLQPRELLHGMGMHGCAQYASACHLAVVVLWVVQGFFLDKRSSANISPGCYPGLHASPLSRTDLSRWAVLCLMWPEVIKSSPAGWCLPPPSLFSLPPLFAGIYPRLQWLRALRGLSLFSLPWYGHWLGSICQLINAYSNSLPPGLGVCFFYSPSLPQAIIAGK